MSLLFSIIITIAICFFFVACELRLVKKAKITNISIWLKGLALGAFVGAINYVTPNLLTWSVLWLAPIFLVLLSFAIIVMIAWGKHAACEWLEYIFLAVIILLMTLTAYSAANMTAALVNHEFWSSLISLLPWILFVAGLFTFIADWFSFRAEKGKNNYKVGGVIATIVAIVLVIVLLITCVNWAAIGSSSKKQSSATTSSTKTGIVFFNDALQSDEIEGNEFNFGFDRYQAATEAWEKSDKSQNKDEFILKWLDDDFKKSITMDPALAAGDIAYADAVLGTRFLGTFYESAKEKWSETINLAKEEFCKNKAAYELHLTEFLAMLDKAEPLLATIDDGVTDQMYMNPYTDLKYGPDVIVMDTDDHTGHLLVYMFTIKDNIFKVAYRVECGYQSVNVAELMHITPVSKPEKPVTPVTPEKPTEPDQPKYNKDKTKGTQGDLVAPNDDPGPGPNTNGGSNSTKDKSSNSNHMTYDEYKSKIEAIEKANQSDSGSTKQPTASSDAKVDDNGAKGTGYGGADDATPVKPVSPEISNNLAGIWSGPAD